MNNKIQTPAWLLGGPNDIEYCTYKLHATIIKIKDKISSGDLVGSLLEIDDNLDYLYMYDAIKITHQPDPVNQIVSELEIPGLEMFFMSDDLAETNEILDELLDEAIDQFEELHSTCREQWRFIENGIKSIYVPSKPYFINDGFVLIKTPDNHLHVYHFVKPSKYFTNDWKGFKLNYLYDETWTDETYFNRVDEIISKDSDKLIIRVDCSTETILENSAISVISQNIFNMLRRDYSF